MQNKPGALFRSAESEQRVDGNLCTEQELGSLQTLPETLLLSGELFNFTAKNSSKSLTDPLAAALSFVDEIPSSEQHGVLKRGQLSGTLLQAVPIPLPCIRFVVEIGFAVVLKTYAR